MADGRDRIMRLAAHAAGSLVVALLGLPPGAAAATPVAIKAEAGLDGLTKPGRWTPVRILIRSAAAPVQGDLFVEWGATSLRRPVQLAAGATQQFEIYLQTMEVAAAVSIRLVSGGQELAAATPALRTLRPDEPFTVCLDGATAPDGACTARPAPEALPRSLRGYDAADRVLGDAGAGHPLSAEQRVALARWRALRALDDNGSIAATDRPRSIMPALDRKSRTGDETRVGLVLYVLALLGAAVVASTRLSATPATLAVIAMLAAAGSAAAVAAGRVGPRSAVIIHHATLVQQLAGASGSIVTMRGAVEYPAFDSFVIQALLSDGAFEGVRQGGREQGTLDENGYPVIAGTFGLGARQPFTLHGVTDFQPLVIVQQDRVAHVTNAGREDMTDCSLAGGRAVGGNGVLKAGATAVADLVDPTAGPLITCSLPDTPVAFAGGRHQVRTAGRVTLAAYLTPPGDARH